MGRNAPALRDAARRTRYRARLLGAADPRYLAGMAIAESGPNSATMTGQLGLYELRAGDVLAGRFRIESMLGIGGMGVVYRAFDQSLDIPVAIKLLRPELARRPEAFERFRQELLLARQVSSPHVVRIHDIAQDGGRWFISMDFIDGQSLEKLLDDTGKLAPENALRITHDLLDGISAAERRGVVHRDLKPANILLDADGSAFITDFGVARSLGATGATGSGVIVGTPEYLSPEQARGQPVDTRSDLYTVGLILYEMLTGALPFSAGTPAESVMQRIVRPPPSLAQARAGLPAWLYAFVDRLLKLNPAHRFASAQEAQRALEARRVPRSPVDRRRMLLAALAALALGGAMTWLWKHPPVLPSSVAPVTPRTAVLPFGAPADDAELRGMARGLDEHLQAWLRDEPRDAAALRRRVLDAVARAAPGVQGDVLLRQLPEIARAADATQILHGQLRRDGAQLVLDLELWKADQAAAQVRIQGKDATALGDAYFARAGELLRKAGISAQAPTFPSADLTAFGQALAAADAHKPEEAAAQLGAMNSRESGNVLITLALLDAQEQAQQDLPAQTTRDHIMADLAAATGATARELQARALIGSDKVDAAIPMLDKAVQDYPHDPALALLDAQTLAQTGAGTKAFANLQQYVASDSQDAEAWFLLGRVAIEQGRAQAAVDDYLTRALVLNTRSGNQAAVALTRNAIGVGYERLGQFDAAAEQYGLATTMYERLGDEEGQAKALRNLALVQAVRGDRETAARTLERVKVLLEKSGDRAKLADLYSARGVVAEEQGNWSDALGFYRQALAIQQQLNQPAGIAESLNNVGFSSYSLGDFDNAMVYWQQALALYRQLDDPAKALRIEESIALLDIARGRFDAARQSLAAAQQKAEDHQLPEEAAAAHIYLGELALDEGRFAEALAQSARAAEVFGRLSDQRGQAEAALLTTRVQLALGDAAGAGTTLGSITVTQLGSEQHAEHLVAAARQAMISRQYPVVVEKLDEAAKLGIDPHGTIGAQIQIERIRLSLAQNDLRRAAKQLADLSAESTRLGEVPLRLLWLELQAAAALRGGKPDDAATHYRQALAILKTTGAWADAAILHELGAVALASRPSDASAARANAQAQQTQLLRDAPEGARAGLQAELTRRLRDEAGLAHD
jgi:tetratricopeptide (TPR) repeat protein